MNGNRDVFDGGALFDKVLEDLDAVPKTIVVENVALPPGSEITVHVIPERGGSILTKDEALAQKGEEETVFEVKVTRVA